MSYYTRNYNIIHLYNNCIPLIIKLYYQKLKIAVIYTSYYNATQEKTWNHKWHMLPLTCHFILFFSYCNYLHHIHHQIILSFVIAVTVVIRFMVNSFASQVMFFFLTFSSYLRPTCEYTRVTNDNIMHNFPERFIVIFMNSIKTATTYAGSRKHVSISQ